MPNKILRQHIHICLTWNSYFKEIFYLMMVEKHSKIIFLNTHTCTQTNALMNMFSNPFVFEY